MRSGIVLALAAGALFGLVGPPHSVYLADWAGLMALAWLLRQPSRGAPGRRLRGALDGAARGLAFGVGANLVFLRFVPPTLVRFTPLSFAAGAGCQGLLAVVQGLAWLVAGTVAVQLARRGVPAWASFGAGVYAGTFVPAVFPWTPASHVSLLPTMIQLGEIVGDRGVTLVMAITAGLAAEAVARSNWGQRARFAIAALSLPALTFVEGSLRVAAVERERQAASSAVVGLIQPSIDALGRWDGSRSAATLAALQGLTVRSEAQGAALTVWTESAYPYPILHSARRVPSSRPLLDDGAHGPVLSGFLTLGPGHDQHNSAGVFTADGAVSEPQDKVHLLAFGEEIPYVGGIPWVRRTFARGIGLVPGDRIVLQTAGEVRASVLVCVEDILPAAGREAMAARPNLLVNVTNDAWFEGTQESELHLRLAIARAVESRRDMIRAVNMGPTTWVDAAGVVQRRYEGLEPGILMARPALLDGGLTLYDRFGDWPTALALFLALASWIAAAARRRSGHPASRSM